MVLSGRYYDAAVLGYDNDGLIGLRNAVMGLYIDAHIGLFHQAAEKQKTRQAQKSLGRDLEEYFKIREKDKAAAKVALEETATSTRSADVSMSGVAKDRGFHYNEYDDGSFDWGPLKKEYVRYNDDPYNSLRAYLFGPFGLRIDPTDDEIPRSFVDHVPGVGEALKAKCLHAAVQLVQDHLVAKRIACEYGTGPERIYDAEECPLASFSESTDDVSIIQQFVADSMDYPDLLTIYWEGLDMCAKLRLPKLIIALVPGEVPAKIRRHIFPAKIDTEYYCIQDIAPIYRRAVVGYILRMCLGTARGQTTKPLDTYFRNLDTRQPPTLLRMSYDEAHHQSGDAEVWEEESGYCSDGSEFSLIAKQRCERPRPHVKRRFDASSKRSQARAREDAKGKLTGIWTRIT